jgi:hypothetical protein
MPSRRSRGHILRCSFIARENLERWTSTSGRSTPYLDEWTRILDRPLEDVLLLIEQEGERMTALCQCSPFAGVLEPKERWAVYAHFSEDLEWT